MKVLIEFPNYDGEGIDVIWDAGSEYEVHVDDSNNDRCVVISANAKGLISLAKQMLYLAYNDLPKGSHVHYDEFFTKIHNQKYELVIGKE